MHPTIANAMVPAKQNAGPYYTPGVAESPETPMRVHEVFTHNTPVQQIISRTTNVQNLFAQRAASTCTIPRRSSISTAPFNGGSPVVVTDLPRC